MHNGSRTFGTKPHAQLARIKNLLLLLSFVTYALASISASNCTLSWHLLTKLAYSSLFRNSVGNLLKGPLLVGCALYHAQNLKGLAQAAPGAPYRGSRHFKADLSFQILSFFSAFAFNSGYSRHFQAAFVLEKREIASKIFFCCFCQSPLWFFFLEVQYK